MWSPSIAKIRAPQWLRENSRKLMPVMLVCVGLFCADLLIYGALIAPASVRLQAMETQSAELRRRHAEAVLFREQRQLFAGIMAGIPAQKDMPILVKDLVQTAKRMNLSVSGVKYDMPSRAGAELAMLSFSFPAKGRYSDIKRFIYNVETSDRLVGIQELKLGEDRGAVSADMKLITYVKNR